MAKFFLFLCSMVLAATVMAEDLPTFKITCNNGVFTPSVLHVAAGKKFVIEITNIGTEAIEFESKQLRKEKALSPGASSFVVIYPLDPGIYKFFDDFHIQKGQGLILAK